MLVYNILESNIRQTETTNVYIYYKSLYIIDTADVVIIEFFSANYMGTDRRGGGLYMKK